MIRWIIPIAFASLLVFAGYLYFYLGLNQKVEISQGKAGPFLFLYKDHRGPYHTIGPIIREVELWALSHNVPCSKTFGHYLDDPDGMDPDRLRSRGGCLLNALPNGLPPAGFQVLNLPEQRYVIADYNGSPAAGPLSVYPAVRKYMEKNRMVYPPTVIEIYSITGSDVHTQYLFQLP